MKKKAVVIAIICIVAIVLLGAPSTGCGTENATLNEQRQESVNVRTESMAKAEAKYPTPTNVNFPIRNVLKEYTERQDLVNHPWYTYVFSDTGAITHYFVSTTLPVSTNAFLGATSTIVHTEDSSVPLVMDAPSLEGIYYGGSGSSSNQNGWIFIDANTGALGVIYNCKIMTFDAPLLLETEPQLITIENK
jgi:hypothetical protein